jgi:hypothetical protein
MLGYGLQKILDHSLGGRSFTSFREGFIKIVMTLALLPLLEWGNILEERCFSLSWELNFRKFYLFFSQGFAYLLSRYDPGHVCIFFSSTIYHKVTRFNPSNQTESEADQKIIPGRIGTVLFFPSESYNILKDKRPRWGLETGFGKNEHLIQC